MSIALTCTGELMSCPGVGVRDLTGWHRARAGPTPAGPARAGSPQRRPPSRGRLARAVNNDIGPATVRFRRATLDLVRNTYPTRSAQAIPAGLPPDLARSVFLVYSDLVARAAAFNYIADADTAPRPVTDAKVRGMLAPLPAGSTIARRFPTDVAALRSLAAASPPFTLAAPSSRATAEVEIRVQYIGTANSGCGSAGGNIFTQLIPITWKRGFSGQTTYDGTIGPNGPPFTARYRPSQGWTVMVNIC